MIILTVKLIIYDENGNNPQSCKLSTFTHRYINTLWILTYSLFVKLADTSSKLCQAKTV